MNNIIWVGTCWLVLFIFNNTFGDEAVVIQKHPLSSKYFMLLRGLNMQVNTHKQVKPLMDKKKIC